MDTEWSKNITLTPNTSYPEWCLKSSEMTDSLQSKESDQLGLPQLPYTPAKLSTQHWIAFQEHILLTMERKRLTRSTWPIKTSKSRTTLQLSFPFLFSVEDILHHFLSIFKSTVILCADSHCLFHHDRICLSWTVQNAHDRNWRVTQLWLSCLWTVGRSLQSQLPFEGKRRCRQWFLISRSKEMAPN